MVQEPGARFILYGRAWCHLCEDMRAALEPIAQRFGATVEYIDIDQDASLVARYDELVPVLTLGGVELCHYRLDAAAVEEALRANSR